MANAINPHWIGNVPAWDIEVGDITILGVPANDLLAHDINPYHDDVVREHHIQAFAKKKHKVLLAHINQQPQPEKCLGCEYWQEPSSGHCMRGSEPYCIKTGTHQAVR